MKTNHYPALKALGDPTRLEIFERVSRKPMAVGELARELPISRPAVSQHLAVLKAAGLVIDHAEGARRVYRVDTAGLAVLRMWLDRFWDGALGAFKAEVEKSIHEDN